MRPSNQKLRLLALNALLVLLLGVIGGVVLDRFALAGLRPPDGKLNFRLISEARDLIHRYYVDRAAEKPLQMTYGAISGMVNSLGDTGHTRFLTPQMVKNLRDLERSNYQGIGAQVRMKGGHVTIVAPLDGSPAERAGLRPGDLILRVNGQQIVGMPLDQVIQLIAGRAGTSVALTIFRPATNRTRQVTLKRAVIKLHDVSWQMLPGTTVADVRVASFGKGTTGELRRALAAIREKSATGIIFDLRNNPGGLLRQAVGVASQFLQGGNVLLVKNAKGQEKPVPAKAGGQATRIPMVVLVNGGTASAAEIVAGALQDRHRAQVVGETTFGTGTVLQEFKLSDGSALLLAVEEWLTPTGQVIWHKGIKPDVAVSLPPQASALIPAAERTLPAAQLRHSTDAQMLRALKLLRHQPSTGF